jgi:hypothetical protein
LEDGAVIEQVCIGVVSVNEKDFGNVSASRPPLDLYDHIERVSDVRFNRAKAKVSPETTMATSESPRAMVLVKAVMSTLTAFSHGELPCRAKAGIASKSTKQIAIAGERSEKLARQFRRTRFMTPSLSPSNLRTREVRGRDISREDRRATVRRRLFRRFAGRFHPGTLGAFAP